MLCRPEVCSNIILLCHGLKITFLSIQTDPGHLEKFQSVLRENPAVFHACRTATSLHHHWVLMGHYGLLNNQKGWQECLQESEQYYFFVWFLAVDLILPEETITQKFEDAEDQLNDNELA